MNIILISYVIISVVLAIWTVSVGPIKKNLTKYSSITLLAGFIFPPILSKTNMVYEDRQIINKYFFRLRLFCISQFVMVSGYLIFILYKLQRM